MRTLKLDLPLSPSQIQSLQPGDKLLLSGVLYTARDKAHQRLIQLIESGNQLPFDLSSSTLFYCGPSPVPPNKICGAIGPTTSSRMDPFTPMLLEHGLRVMIGKGDRSEDVQRAIRKHNAVYLVAVGGISALLARCVTYFELFAWEELGPEAIYKMQVQDFPCYVGYL
ncbi:MAG: TRZ/ATZ family protein [Candidatus Cloacimonetes bacterium]|nr:TRZ/ATZ family protein [Candidatus Cloacimonadota bacterium]